MAQGHSQQRCVPRERHAQADTRLTVRTQGEDTVLLAGGRPGGRAAGRAAGRAGGRAADRMWTGTPSNVAYCVAVNHALFFKTLAPNPNNVTRSPTGALLAAIDRDFHSFSDFQVPFGGTRQ